MVWFVLAGWTSRYAVAHGQAMGSAVWTPADFAEERVFEGVASGKFWILGAETRSFAECHVRPAAPVPFLLSRRPMTPPVCFDEGRRQQGATWHARDGAAPNDGDSRPGATICESTPIGVPGCDPRCCRGRRAGRSRGDGAPLVLESVRQTPFVLAVCGPRASSKSQQG